jgi:hypothetical protein
MTDQTTTTATTNDTQALRHEIEAQRSALGRDLVALGDHVSPGAMVTRKRNAVTQRVRSLGDRLMGSAEHARGSVTSTAGDATSQVTEGISSVPGAIASKAEGSPLAMGLVAFGAGIVAASLVPATKQERAAGSRLEPALQQAAAEVGTMARDDLEAVKPIAQQAAQDLRDDAADAAKHVQAEATDRAEGLRDQAQQGAQHVADDAKG